MTIAACYLSAEGVVFGADTIKTMKFSHMAPVCGGPVEIAVVTTDRKFRWVRHKKFDAAIGEGGLFDVYRD